MKYPMRAFRYIFLCLLAIIHFSAGAQGDSYTNAITIEMDGVVRDYPTSTGSGANVLCTNNGTTPVTWFSFTTINDGICPLLSFTASDELPCEIAMYTSISGNINNNLEVNSSMCFYDGTGLWAPAETFIVSAGKTYYIRIKTSSDCTIKMAGQFITPSNDDCSGAMSIGTTATSDNNACHLPGPQVTPGQLCAFTLENTAFYQFYVASAGNSIINISDISCDNGANNNNTGFQIGFFTGNCNSLVPVSCTSGVGNFVQATSPPLPAGTKVYVAIDGTSGSNCTYNIGGINVVGVLEAGIRDFSIWETALTTQLRWTTHRDFNGQAIIIERSPDGRQFYEIGQIRPGEGDGRERFFQFDDVSPLPHAFYRLQIRSANNGRGYSMIKESRRTKNVLLQFKFQNPFSSRITATLITPDAGKVDISIINDAGQTVLQEVLNCRAGSNFYSRDLSMLANGRYFITIKGSQQVLTTPLIKLR